MSNCTRAHPLDRLINDDLLFIVEGLIPFVDFKFKKLLFLFIKFKETTSILTAMDNHKQVEECGLHIANNSNEDMFEKIFEFLPNDLSQNFSSIKSMMQMMQMMQMAEAMGSFDDDNSFNESCNESPNNDNFNNYTTNSEYNNVNNNSEYNNNDNNNGMMNMDMTKMMNMAKMMNSFNTNSNDFMSDFDNNKNDNNNSNSNLFDSILSILDEADKENKNE